MRRPRAMYAAMAAFLSLVLGACGETDPSSGDSRQAVPDTGPDALRASTEAELRQRVRVGLEIIHDLRSLFMPPKEQWLYVRRRVTRADENGITIEVTTLDDQYEPQEYASGALENPRYEEYTWKELADEFAWKADTVVVTEETVETPAGTFEARRFDLGQSGPSGWTEHIWFAKDIPYFPLRILILGKNGRTEINSKSVVRWSPAPPGEAK